MTPDNLHSDALVWDQTFPATPTCGSWLAHFDALERLKAAGYSVVSITVASDPDDTMSALGRIAMWRRYIAENADRYLLMTTADHAERARSESPSEIISFPGKAFAALIEWTPIAGMPTRSGSGTPSPWPGGGSG